jgi:alpha-glucosidase (family GH31 glycosyl hydrolase)
MPLPRARTRTAVRWGVAGAAVLLLLLTSSLGSAVIKPAASRSPLGDTSPVNLAANVNLAAGKAATGATVTEGDARFEVLTPEVIRLEYSPDGQFLDLPTFDVLDRDLSVPSFTEKVESGWLVLETSKVVLRYELGSGPFDSDNTQLQLIGTSSPTVAPSWEWECTYGQVCQAGAASLSGGAELADDHAGSQSPAGFVAGYTVQGSTATWTVLGAPAGAATVTIRYSNSVGLLGGPAPRTMSLVIDGTSTQVTFQPTSSWDDWASVSVPITLPAGSDALSLTCGSGDDCNINVDDVAVAPAGVTPVPFLPAGQLGGYIRSFDSATYGTAPACGSGESGDTCVATLPSESAGLLDRSGWYLLDDTSSAVWTSDGWIRQRPAGDVEDGYLFGYGEDYAAALADLAKLTGPAPLLPEYVFGNWYSDYYPYTDTDYEDQLLPEFQSNGVPLDTLSIDTDWKSPNTWDGWEWNSSLFPDPSSFLSWASSQGIHVTLNIHSSIATDDPQYSQAQAIAGNDLATTSCDSGPCAVWDWAQESQAESNFDLQQPIEQQGVSFFWLDWCCDNSLVSMPGVTPDSWVDHLYAQQLANSGQRGFVLARIGASLEDPETGAYATGAWADHRSVLHFTGDTWSSWNTLAFEAELAADEGSIGEPYVSDDIGGFLGPPPGGPDDPEDLYLRWLQLGTFQPVMRLHSNAGDRLPWQYGGTTQTIGDQFLQLRESLVPYTYTLAADSVSTGLPIVQALYLDYPSQPAAYDHPGEYLFGPDLLVAPVTTPGTSASVKVWFPAGRWVDWFTGAVVNGPTVKSITSPLDQMPVFVRAGGIVPLQPSDDQAAGGGAAPITLRVFSGAAGTFSLYDDAGSGLGYQNGQSTRTPVSYTVGSGGTSSTVVVGKVSGSYPGAPISRSYDVQIVDISAPGSVLLDGKVLPRSSWSYDPATKTLSVTVGAVAAGSAATVTERGGTASS